MTYLSHLSRHLKTAFINNRWGGQALISLYISILSGIILALQYNVTSPYYSTASIELIIPYGSFWRALHYYSSQAFFLLLLCHVAAVLVKKAEIHNRWSWLRLCSSLPSALLLLFTGYVLRADATGEAAGLIAENICLSIPIVGGIINNLFFDIQQSGLYKVYTHHLIGLVVLGGWSIWPHLKRYPAYWKNHLALSAFILTLSTLIAAPIEPDHPGLLLIAGPWFFLGLQELLRYLPTFVAGVLIPLFPLIMLYLLPHSSLKRKIYLFLILAWTAVYSIITLISYGHFSF